MDDSSSLYVIEKHIKRESVWKSCFIIYCYVTIIVVVVSAAIALSIYTIQGELLLERL